MKRSVSVAALLFFIIPGVLIAQSGPLAYILPAGDKAIIVLANTPRDTAGFDVYRRGPDDKDFRLLTPNSIRAVDDAHEAARLMGTDFRWLARRTGSLDPAAVWRKLKFDRGQAMAYSLISHGLRVALGRAYIDEGVRPGTTYRYRVQLLDTDGRNGDRFEREVTIEPARVPAPPASVEAAPRDGEVLITWEHSEYSGKDDDTVVGFHLYRSARGEPRVQLTSAPVLRVEGFLSYLDQQVENGVPYAYEIASVDIIGVTSTTISAPPVIPVDNRPPLVPGDLTAIDNDEGVLLIWRMSAELDLASYNVYSVSELGDGEELTKLNRAPIPGDEPRYLHRDTERGTLAIYRVSAVDTSGNESPPSGPATIVPKDPDPPAPVAGVAATADEESRQVNITWDASTEKDLLGYHVYRGESEEMLYRLAGALTTETTLTDAGYEGRGLTAGASLLYAVSAVDTSYNEGQLSIITVVIPDIVPPEPPAGLAARILPDGTVRLRWQPQYVPDLQTARVYKNSGDTWAVTVNVDALEGEWMDTDAERGKPVLYRVTQIDRIGNESMPSEEIEVIPTDTVAPQPPVLAGVVEENGGITIRWAESAESDIAGYRIHWSAYAGGRWRVLDDEIVTALEYHDRKGKPGRLYGVSAVDTSGNESAVSEGRNAE